MGERRGAFMLVFYIGAVETGNVRWSRDMHDCAKSGLAMREVWRRSLSLPSAIVPLHFRKIWSRLFWKYIENDCKCKVMHVSILRLRLMFLPWKRDTEIGPVSQAWLDPASAGPPKGRTLSQLGLCVYFRLPPASTKNVLNTDMVKHRRGNQTAFHIHLCLKKTCPRKVCPFGPLLVMGAAKARVGSTLWFLHHGRDEGCCNAFCINTTLRRERWGLPDKLP